MYALAFPDLVEMVKAAGANRGPALAIQTMTDPRWHCVKCGHDCGYWAADKNTTPWAKQGGHGGAAVTCSILWCLEVYDPPPGWSYKSAREQAGLPAEVEEKPENEPADREETGDWGGDADWDGPDDVKYTYITIDENATDAMSTATEAWPMLQGPVKAATAPPTAPPVGPPVAPRYGVKLSPRGPAATAAATMQASPRAAKEGAGPMDVDGGAPHGCAIGPARTHMDGWHEGRARIRQAGTLQTAHSDR